MKLLGAPLDSQQSIGLNSHLYRGERQIRVLHVKLTPMKATYSIQRQARRGRQKTQFQRRAHDETCLLTWGRGIQGKNSLSCKFIVLGWSSHNFEYCKAGRIIS